MPTPVLPSAKRRCGVIPLKGLIVILVVVTIVSFVLFNVTIMLNHPGFDTGTSILAPLEELLGDDEKDRNNAADENHNRILQPPTSPPTEPIPDLLLSVPFYVYEDFAWINGTIGEHLISNRNLHHSFNGTNRFKHGDDYFLLLASLNHPMRTRNIHEARLFFVPTLLNHYDYYVEYLKWNLCVNDRCNMDLIDYTREQLEQSEAFQLYPEKHLVVRSHFVSPQLDRQKKYRKVPGYDAFFKETLTKMSVVTFEAKEFSIDPRHATQARQHFHFPSYYVGSPCLGIDGSTTTNRSLDVALIAAMKDEFHSRQLICDWLAKRSPGIQSVCGKGKRCPTLTQTKFGFHVAGDTFGSQRLMDLIMCGAVPIFTDASQYAILGDWIDWDQLSYFLPVYDSSTTNNNTGLPLDDTALEVNFMKRFEAILNDKLGYEQRRRAVVQHIPFFDYNTIHPFDTFMYLFQARVYPETRRTKSKWPALILPPVVNSHTP